MTTVTLPRGRYKILLMALVFGCIESRLAMASRRFELVLRHEDGSRTPLPIALFLRSTVFVPRSCRGKRLIRRSVRYD